MREWRTSEHFKSVREAAREREQRGRDQRAEASREYLADEANN